MVQIGLFSSSDWHAYISYRKTPLQRNRFRKSPWICSKYCWTERQTTLISTIVTTESPVIHNLVQKRLVILVLSPEANIIWWCYSVCASVFFGFFFKLFFSGGGGYATQTPISLTYQGNLSLCRINSSPPLDKMAAISQTIHINAFLWMRSLKFWYHWSLFLRF